MAALQLLTTPNTVGFADEQPFLFSNLKPQTRIWLLETWNSTFNSEDLAFKGETWTSALKPVKTTVFEPPN